MKTKLIAIAIGSIVAQQAVAGSPNLEVIGQNHAKQDSSYWYVGGQLGGHDFFGKFDHFDALTGRAIVGYQFTPNFGVEANLVGHEAMSKKEIYRDELGRATDTFKFKYEYSPEFDLLAKVSGQFNDHFGVYGKIGFGIWKEKAKIDYHSADYFFVDNFLATEPDTMHSSAKSTDTKLDAVGAVGLTLQITDNLSTDVSLTINYNEDYKERYTLGAGFTYAII